MLYKGSCHCGTIEFELNSELNNVKQCNCSICIRKFAKMAMAVKEDLKILKGESYLSMYQFGTNVAKHYFCKICGIYTHHNKASDPNGIGVNTGCLKGIDPFQYDAEVFNKK